MKTRTRRNPFVRLAGFLTACLLGLSAVPLQCLTAFAASPAVKPFDYGEVFRNGDIIDFGDSGECVRLNDQEDIPDEGWEYYHGQWSVSYVKYVPGTGQYQFLMQKDPVVYSYYSQTIRITSEDRGTPIGFRIIDGGGVGDSPYLLGVVFAKPAQVGETYNVGEWIDFGTDTRCLYDDTDSERAVLSGMYEVSSCEYDEGYEQYHFMLNGNDDVDVWLTSGNCGTPVGIKVTGGSGTQSDPYTFGLVFAKPAQVGATYKIGEWIDFGTGTYFVWDDWDPEEYRTQLTDVWTVSYSAYFYYNNNNHYKFILRSGSSTQWVWITAADSENPGTLLGFTVTGGSGTQSDPYTFGLVFAKPLAAGETYRDGDVIDFGTGVYCILDDQHTGSSLVSDIQEVVFDCFNDEVGQSLYYFRGAGDTSKTVWLTPDIDAMSTIPVGFRVTGGDGTQSNPYEFGLVFAKQIWTTSVFKTGDYINFDYRVFKWIACNENSDDEIEKIELQSEWQLLYVGYDHNNTQYVFQLANESGEVVDVCIFSDDLGTPTGIKVTGGDGTERTPYTFDPVFAKAVQVGEIYRDGDLIVFGDGDRCLCNDQDSDITVSFGICEVSYSGYYQTSRYLFRLTGNCYRGIWLHSENLGTPAGFTVTGGSGTGSDPYTFGLVFEQPAKPVQVGETYKIGDTIDFGTEKYCLYDDTDDETAVLSGMYEVSFCEYKEECSQYYFRLTGNRNAALWITSDDIGTPEGFMVTGGSGTQSDPYTFGLVFAKPVRMGATYKVGDYIDFEDGNWIVDDDSKIDDYYGDKYVFASELSGVWQLKDARYVENRGQYRFTLVNESGSDTVNIRTTSEDFGTPSGMVIVWGEGLDEPFIAKAMPPVKSPQSGGIYWLREAVDFGEGVYCVLNEQGTAKKLSGIWYINKGYYLSSSSSGNSVFELLGGGDIRNLYISSGNTRPPVGFRITGGDGSASNPYTFEPVFAEAETVQVGKTYKVGDMIDFVDDVGRDAYCIITGPLELIRGVAKVEEYLGYDSGKYVFRVKELEYGTSHYLRISSENLGTPAGFTVTGGKGLYVHPFTFGVVFDFTTDSVTLTKTSFTCTGKEVKIGSYVRVKCGDTALKYNTDFTLSYENNVNCGVNTASVTITGIGSYTGSVTKYYSILPKKQAKPALSTALSPNNNWGLHVEWAADANAQGYEVQYCKKSDFTGDTLHSVAYASKTACDLTTYPKLGETWYVRVRSYIKDSAGTKYGFWSDIASTTLAAQVTTVTLTQTEFACSGREVKIGSYVRVKCGDTALKYNTDFTMSYENNVNCGINTASVTITGIGNYTGSVTKYYSILPKKQAKPALSTALSPNNNWGLHVEWAADANAQGYEVQYCKKSDFTGDTLHSVAYASKTACDLTTYPKLGETWYVRVRSYIKDSAGTKYGFWSDTASTKLIAKVTEVTLTQSTFAYTGREVKIGSYVRVKAGTTALKYGQDFTMSYANNVNCGINTASVTITGIGNYTGTVTKYYTIVPVKQAKPTLGTNGGALHVRWAADSNAKGYQVQYCRDASFTGETFHSKAFATKTEYDLSEYPKTGETWYVRVRSYITNSSGTKYGLWSDTASITLGTIDSAALTQTEFAYTGKPVKVGSYIKVKSGTTALKYDVDFTLAYANNVSRGTATVTAVGIGEYAGSSVSTTYKIK